MVNLGNKFNAVSEMVDACAVPRTGWLAGYPRSGCALVRTVIANYFGHKTSSMYEEGSVGEAYARFIGHTTPERSLVEIGEIANAQGMFFFKTHNRPLGQVSPPCIIVVRDGRRTLASLRAFYRERNGHDYDWEALILGRHPWGNWSGWVSAWANYAPPDALWLRYGETVKYPEVAAAKIAERFRLRLLPDARMPEFSAMQAAAPDIFRKAATEGNGEMPGWAEELFWRVHGSTQTMLGFGRE